MADTLDTTTREQDAVRLLILLRYAADSDLTQPAPVGAVACISGELRLQAMDFWLRNPDYLADELLNMADADGRSELRESARRILIDEEPDLRTYPMLRYKHGAWEPLDDSLGILRAYGLVRDERRGAAAQGRRDFYLLGAGQDAVDSLVADIAPLSWYADRAILVREVAGDAGGTELKLRQKEQIEYRDATWLQHIPSIRDRVLERLSSGGKRTA